MSNDTAACGCEGHADNLQSCLYPEAVRHLNFCLSTIKLIREDLRDQLVDCDSPGTRQTLEVQIDYLTQALEDSP